MNSCIVVDDDKNTVHVFTDILELLGLEVRGYGYDGNSAVSLYKQHRPDIVFIDMTMPIADGFFAIEKIKEFDPNAKIVAVTADFTLETQQRLEKDNVLAIIYKPFNQDQIKQVLLEKYQINLN